jgi:hypothetical protein
MSANQNVENESTQSQRPVDGDDASPFDFAKNFSPESISEIEKVFGEKVKQLGQLVRKHPVEAMAIGFGVGCLVGLLVSRRR